MTRQPRLLACHMIATASRQISKYYGEHFESFGLSFPRIQILRALSRRDGQKPSALAAAIAAKASSMTALLDSLEQAALIERRRDPHDRRALRVYLTTRGRRLHKDVMGVVFQFNTELARRLNDSELETFARVMKTIEQMTHSGRGGAASEAPRAARG